MPATIRATTTARRSHSAPFNYVPEMPPVPTPREWAQTARLPPELRPPAAPPQRSAYARGAACRAARTGIAFVQASIGERAAERPLPLAGGRPVDHHVGGQRPREQAAQLGRNVLKMGAGRARVVRSREQPQDHEPELVRVGGARARRLAERRRDVPVAGLHRGERLAPVEHHRVAVDQNLGLVAGAERDEQVVRRDVAGHDRVPVQERERVANPLRDLGACEHVQANAEASQLEEGVCSEQVLESVSSTLSRRPLGITNGSAKRGLT